MKIFKRVLATLAIISLLLFLTLIFLQISNPQFKTTFTLLGFALCATSFGLWGILTTKNSFDDEDLMGQLFFSLSTVIAIVGVFAMVAYLIMILHIKLL